MQTVSAYSSIAPQSVEGDNHESEDFSDSDAFLDLRYHPEVRMAVTRQPSTDGFGFLRVFAG